MYYLSHQFLNLSQIFLLSHFLAYKSSISQRSSLFYGLQSLHTSMGSVICSKIMVNQFFILGVNLEIHLGGSRCVFDSSEIRIGRLTSDIKSVCS